MKRPKHNIIQRRIKTLIRVGDKVVVLSGEGRNVVTADKDGKEVKRLATVRQIDRLKGHVMLEFEGLPRERDGEGRDRPIRGVEILKNHRFNPQAQDPGGQRVKTRWIDISNIALVDPSTGTPGDIVRKKDGRKIMRLAKKTGTMF